jgi:TfoX/Sxy family transcriptional regulator of competence genes
VAYDQELAARVRAAIAAQPDVEEKKMFGGVTFMVAGQMCCGVLKSDLVVRVGETGYAEALADPHVRPFDFSGRPGPGMVYVASAALTSEQALGAWVQRGVDYVTTHPRTAAKRKR